tara:strand:+ start:986 stop:1963 length:978 start_codon:yes stop_codon:yes gene_type:complete
MKVVVVGGAGYIGSHVVLSALEKGFEVTIFDNLSTGLKININKNANFIEGSINSSSDLKKLFEKEKYNGLIHLAASKAAGESMKNPIKYAENNIMGGINLLSKSIKYGIKRFVFSSSAAVYGTPQYIPIDEKHQLDPSNYYGYTKLLIERNLEWFSMLKNFRFASLRYFNAAGYDKNNKIRGLEQNPQNLIPIIMEVASGERNKMKIYGNDYKTRDGTGIRDYVHVSDLAKAHIDALDYLYNKKKNLTVNLGAGRGYSVFEVIKKVEEITKVKIDFEIVARRFGDSDKVIADSSIAEKLINWSPKYSDLGEIIRSTWRMYKNKKN